ncbi:MAG TPA: DNA primase [Burkholderiaceae bacterium]
MIPGQFVQDLLARVDIVELVGRTVTLKKAGINYKGLCPFHGEKSPSFIVSPTRQTYHCFGCGVHGDAIRFLVEQHGMGFVDAVTDLAQQVGMPVPEDNASPEERAEAARKKAQVTTLTDLLAKAADHYKQQLKASPRAIDYLKGRGLSGEIAARFALGFSPDGWRTLASCFPRYDDPLLVESGMVIVSGDDPATQKRYDRFRDRIMFPIRNVKGEVIAFGGRVLDKGEPKYLNSPETPIFSKGRELYGLFEARQGLRDKGYVLVTEGYMDVVALAQLGFPNAVATLGTACTAEHVHKLLRFTDKVVFSFDGDAAGRRAAGRALEAALPHATDTRSFRFLFLPKEHDPDSYVREHGPKAFEQYVQDALPLSQQLVEVAQLDCDMTTAEGRARMLAQARPLWSALPEGALQMQLLGELAIKAHLPLADLQTLWKTDAPRARRAPRAHDAGDGAPWDDAPPGLDDANAAHAGADAFLAPGEHAPRGRGRDFQGGKPAWKSLRPTNPKWAARQREEAELEAQRRQPRSAPKTAESRAVQMLFGHPEYWERLSADEHALMHGLPAPYGPLVAWLERDHSEHGPRPWAVLSHALRQDPSLGEEALSVADGDADPGATFEDFRRNVDKILDRELRAQTQALIARAASDPDALQRYREVYKHWEEVKARLSARRAEE